MIRTRTKTALSVKRQRGERTSRYAPVGFRFEDGRVVPEPAEVAVLDRIKDMRARGLSIRRVAEVLNAEGCRLRGGVWHEATIAKTLRRTA